MLSAQPSIEDRLAELEEAMCVPEDDLKNVTVLFEQQNPIFRRELERLETPIYEFDAILVLTEEIPGAEGLSSDSRSMISMLLCRDLQKQDTIQQGHGYLRDFGPSYRRAHQACCLRRSHCVERAYFHGSRPDVRAGRHRASYRRSLLSRG